MSKPAIIYKSGDRYGKLMFTGKSYRNDSSRLFVECVCDCGLTSFMMYNRIKLGETVSCGCKRNPHGMTVDRHPIYSAWLNIKTRCYQEDGRDYPEYGGRGIKVCDEWKNDFKVFYRWAINNGWQQGLTLDRYPNNETGNYEPGNCRWATEAQQNRNRRSNKLLTAFGETKCIADWLLDERCGVKTHSAINRRMFIMRWDVEKAITTKSKK